MHPVQNSRWQEEGGRIHFAVTSQGDSASDVIKYRSYPMERLMWDVSAKSLLHSPSFAPTTAGTRKDLVIVPGPCYFKGLFVPADFCEQYWREGLRESHVEDLALVRSHFSDEEFQKLGLRIILMMHPSVRVYGVPGVLGMCRLSADEWGVAAVQVHAGFCVEKDLRHIGFVFHAP